ncbi:hypothetical protein DB88DRAFT_512888 [Papiliotrema laurentii]|uniref:Uncharacterized protein n=1 Tax=Papiliotrema laurentii TaxID=5418 RepID=A0AAD9FNM8_PAPLA|nr:hypothetical protein DB88DRAFT_512888 [Papiliotrema laurentii]
MTAVAPRLRTVTTALRRSSAYPTRQFSSSLRAFESSSTKDPNHPHLWYHPLADSVPPRIALSFLPDPPVFGSRTILGYLPATQPTGLSDFKEEHRFLGIVHEAIKSGLEQGKAETVAFEASTRPGDGYIHITDERAVPPAGRIGETEDLIGSVFVQEGKVVASTYEPFPAYRLLTSNGPLVLPRGLDTHLVERLKAIDAGEKAEKK